MIRRSRHLGLSCLLGAAVLSAAAGHASAQGGESFPPLPTVMVDEVFAPISVREAISRGKAEGRLVIVVTALARPPLGREAWWANATLRQWLMREAIVVWAQPGNADLNVWVRSADRGEAYAFAGMDLFIDGVHVPGAGGPANYNRPGRVGSDFSPALNDTAPVQLAGTPAPTAEWVLTLLSTQRELATVRSPVFAHRAGERPIAPAPTAADGKPPADPALVEPVPVFSRSGQGVPAIMDLQREPAAEWRAVIQRTAEASGAASAGRAGDAIAAWTWLWERSATIDPAAAFIGELALVAMLETAERTEIARERLVALVESNPGDLDLIGPGAPRAFGAPSDASFLMLLSSAGTPAAFDAAAALGAEDLATWRRTSRRAISSVATAELRKLVSQTDRRTALALDQNAASIMLADLRDAVRPAVVRERQWEVLQSIRRAQIIALHARAAYLCARAGGRLDIDAGDAARRLFSVSKSWPGVDRAAAARAIGLAFVLGERRPPALLDVLQAELDAAGQIDPARPTQALIDAVIALPDTSDRRK